jgi:hypothetical protein
LPNDPVTANVLTDWLRRSASLGSGTVVDVHVESEIDTPISRLTFLTATYSREVPGDLPRNLLVKSPHRPEATRDEKGGEAYFYRSIAPSLAAPPLVRCLAAIQEEVGRPEIIVLEDLRATHDHPPWPLPPARTQCERAMDAMARIHAHWWEAPTLGDTVGRLHTVQSLTSMVHGVAQHLPAFFDALGDTMAAESRRVFERVFSGSLAPWLRITDTRALTLGHGDAHSWNFLFPRSGDAPAYLIDWQLWHLDIGARDLAFLMALHWYPRQRREFELPLLRHYHERLQSHAVDGYSFDELWLDYRRCVVRNLTMPIIYWSRGFKPQAWWHRLECALAAYHDLDCEDLA